MKRTLKLNNLIFMSIFYILVLILAYFTTYETISAYSKDRLLNEYRNQSQYLAKLWTYEAGGSFYLKDGIPYTANGNPVAEECKKWYEEWSSSILSTNCECSAIVYDGQGYRRMFTSLVKDDGSSMQGSYIENVELINRFENSSEYSDYTGFLEIGGIDYVVSYSFFYSDEIDNIPFICFLAENLSTIKGEMNKKIAFIFPIFAIVLALLFLCTFTLINRSIRKYITGKIEKTASNLTETSKSLKDNAGLLKAAEASYEVKNKALKDTINQLIDIIKSVSDNKPSFSSDSQELLEILDKILLDCSTSKKDFNRLQSSQNNTIAEIELLKAKFEKNESVETSVIIASLDEFIKELKGDISIENKIKILPTKLVDDVTYSKSFIEKFNDFITKTVKNNEEIDNKLFYIETKLKDHHLMQNEKSSYRENLENEINSYDSAINTLNKLQ